MRGAIPGVRAVLVLAIAPLLLAGCASGTEDDVRETARDFHAAIAAGDWARACARLAPGTRDEVESAARTTCPQALAQQPPPAPGQPADVAIFGTTAQLSYDTNTLFLTRHRDGWMVLATDCIARRVRADQPYECQIKGG